MTLYNVTVLASGGGGNLRAIIENEDHLRLFRVIKVVTSRSCGALAIASEYGLESEILNYSNPGNYFKVIPRNSDLIVLAGFMPIVPKNVCEFFLGKIINTHPSLLPKYGGRGMYGVKVHEAVLAAKEEVTGCTVHFVTEGVDEGPVIIQESLEIPDGVDAWTLGGLVFNLETRVLPKAISLLAEGKVS